MDNTVLELIEKEPNGLKNKTIKSIIYQTLKGLNHLHKNNIVHRDIKPENLLIDKKENLKICDFGFARYFKSFPLTDYVSTRWYRSPELLMYDGEYEKPADIWGLGCVMAELIDGNPLFEGNDQISQLNLICKLFGSLPPFLKSKLDKMKIFNLRIPPFKKTNTLENKYKNFKDKNGLDLLKKMLNLDPNLRITAKEALTHPYFEDLIKVKIKTKIKNYDKEILGKEKLIKNTKEKIKEIKNKNVINNNYNYHFYNININQNTKKNKSYNNKNYQNNNNNYHNNNNIANNYGSNNYNNNNYGTNNYSNNNYGTNNYKQINKNQNIKSNSVNKNNKFNLTIQKNQNVLNKKEIMLLSTVKPNLRNEENNERRISMNKYGNNYYSNFVPTKIKPINISNKNKEVIKTNNNNNNHKFIIQSKIIKNNNYNTKKLKEKFSSKNNIWPNIKADFKISNPYKIPFKNFY